MIPEASDFYRLLERIEGRLANIESKLAERTAIDEQTESLKQAASALEAAVKSNKETP